MAKTGQRETNSPSFSREIWRNGVVGQRWSSTRFQKKHCSLQPRFHYSSIYIGAH